MGRGGRELLWRPMARKGVVGRLLLLVLCVGGTAAPSQPVHEPLLPGQPFLVLWGVPDAACLGRPDPRGDLMNTIGESAAMGAAGVIVWEKVISDKSQVLGPYVVNVTTASRLCSATLCRGRGRCVRREPGGSAYLHLPPTTFLLLPDDAGRVEVEGRLAPAQRNAWRRDFQCQWYGGLEGGATDEKINSIRFIICYHHCLQFYHNTSHKLYQVKNNCQLLWMGIINLNGKEEC
uniref:Hyaluronidase n=1 Tax=Paramormyrops kingsleyae TaxID=1676925 RepID=A0A3B3SU48_9TELE